MTHKEALARIKELEALVKILAARPIEVHHHNDFAGPYVPPQYPAPAPSTTPGVLRWQNPIVCNIGG